MQTHQVLCFLRDNACCKIFCCKLIFQLAPGRSGVLDKGTKDGRLGELIFGFHSALSVVLLFWIVRLSMVLCLVTTYLFLSSSVLFLRQTLWMTIDKTFLIIFTGTQLGFKNQSRTYFSQSHTLMSCLREEMRRANHRVMAWFNHSGTDTPYFIRLWKRGAFIKINVAAQQIDTNNSEKFGLVGNL